MSMKQIKDQAFKAAKWKAVREQRNIEVYEDDDKLWIQPEEIEDLNKKKIKVFNFEEVSNEEIRYEEVKDHSTLSEGDQVLVNGEVEIIERVSSRQITTDKSGRFRKSDGVEWGGGDKKIDKKLVVKDG